MATTGAKPRICLIDDEKDFTDLTGALLRLNGFEVDAYNRPVAGLAAARNGSFDAVVADIMMPDLDGIALLRSLREGAGESLKLFALSAKKLTDEDRHFLLTNKIQVIRKPFDPRRFVEMLRTALLS